MNARRLFAAFGLASLLSTGCSKYVNYDYSKEFDPRQHEYVIDPDFSSISSSVDYWQSVIDKYYSKYQGIYKTHVEYIKQVTLTGKLVSPFGRFHEFIPKKSYKGLEYNESDIANHINQGLGADIVCLARTISFNKAKKEKINALFVSTVHDSLV